MVNSLQKKLARRKHHCVKSVRIRSYAGKCGKIWTRITPNTDTFHAEQGITGMSLFLHQKDGCTMQKMGM